MLSLQGQIQSGRLVCPKTHRPLSWQGDRLVTPGGEISYPLLNGVPILLASPEVIAGYLARQSGIMVTEYSQPRRPFRRAYDRLSAAIGDLRTPQSETAFRSSLDDLPSDALCVSVGGGPVRVHPQLVNVNIGAFANVDVVADAYALPYAPGSVDAFHCEAVLEHLEFPERAVAEMFRALRPGRLAFAATPFLQAFHGYPDHYQNFTLTGHRRLFERAGFEIVSAGSCVGPTFAIRDLTLNYIRSLPGGKVASRLFGLLTLPLLWLDLFTGRKAEAHILASTTFLLARKPRVLAAEGESR
jgi:SAM-dependent methyltransferase